MGVEGSGATQAFHDPKGHVTLARDEQNQASPSSLLEENSEGAQTPQLINGSNLQFKFKQVGRLKKQIVSLNKFTTEMKKHIICGDINIDRNENNDPLERNDLKALAPIWEEFISDRELTQLNFKPTWHMPGKKSSLLDLYYANCPNLIDGVANVLNLLSEHD